MKICFHLLSIFLLGLPYCHGQISNRLDSGYSGNVVAGNAIELWCTVVSPDAGSLQSCSWTTPDDLYYQVNSDGTVTDGNNPINGVSANTSDPQSCHINVDVLPDTQIGAWSCQTTSSGSAQYQVSVVNVINTTRVEDVRIPTHLDPVQYTVQLIPYIIVDNFTFDGEVQIDLVVVQQANYVYIHSKEQILYEDTVEVRNMDQDRALPIEGFGYDAERDFFIIYLSEDMNVNDNIRVYIQFLGNLNDELSGFYRSSYVDSTDGTTHYLATTQFQATDARKAFPCLDEPALKAVFNIRIGHLPEYVATSNMPIAQSNPTLPGHDGYVLDIFEPTYPMSTYLVAFIVSDFVYRESVLPSNNVTFQIWSRTDVYDQTEYSSIIGPNILEYYESYFNVSFPLPKQGMAAIPDLSFGGMENWGLVTYREYLLLFEEGVSSSQDKASICSVVGHELAHMWFGDLVTIGWWSDLWLNEGFANYVAYIGGNVAEPTYGWLDRFLLENNLLAYSQDALESSHPVQVEVEHPDEINEIFDAITYEKGASLVRMMASFLGIDTFNKGITNYLNKYAYSNAFQDDLWQELTAVAEEDGALEPGLTVKTIMDTWTLKKGFPFVSVTRVNDTHFSVRQERFLLGEKDQSDTTDYHWWVPISFTYAGGSFAEVKNQAWLPPNDQELFVPIPNDFPSNPTLIFNILASNYYRVNYEDADWLNIANILQTSLNDIQQSNRAELLSDALELAKAGHLDYTIAMEQTEYLNLEEEYVPWQSGSWALDYVTLMLISGPDANLIGNYLIEKVSHIYNRLGYDSQPNDSYFDILLRELSMEYMCEWNAGDCVTRSTSDFDAWMNSPLPDLEFSNPTEAANRPIAYCASIADGGSEEWDFLFDRYLGTNNANEKNTILYALGCSKDIFTLVNYLNMAMDPGSGIRRQDGGTVVAGVAQNVVGNPIAWDWMQREWDNIIDYYDTAVSSPVAGMVDDVTKPFNTQTRLQELQQFQIDNQNNLGTAERAVESAIVRTEANVEWMVNYYDVVVGWLNGRI